VIVDSITIALASPEQIVYAASTINFTATVSAPNTNTADIYLNSDSFNVDPPLTVDDCGFFGSPLFLNPRGATRECCSH